MKESLQEVLEAEMTEAVGASPGERTADRLGYRAGYYSRGLVTRIGKLEFLVPLDHVSKKARAILLSFVLAAATADER